MTTCKVCSTQYEGDVCPTCGYVEVAIPEAAPQRIKDIEAQRIEVMKALYQRSINTPVADNAPTVDTSSYEAAISKLNQEIMALNHELGQVKSINKDHNDKLVEAKAANHPIASSPTPKLEGIIELTNVKTGDKAALPILAGRYSYGAAPTAGTDIHIDLDVFSFSMPNVLFAIDVSDVYSWRIFNKSSVSVTDRSGRAVSDQGTDVFDASPVMVNGEVKVEFFRIK